MQVMKIAMDRADAWDNADSINPGRVKRIMDGEHNVAIQVVRTLTERVDRLGTMLSKMPALMKKLREDHRKSLESIKGNLKDLTMWLEAAKKAESLRNVERTMESRRQSASALKEWEDSLLDVGARAGKEERLHAGERLKVTTDEGRALQAEMEAVRAEKAKAVAEFKTEKAKAVADFKAVAAGKTHQEPVEPLLSRPSFRLTLLRKLATMKKSLIDITDDYSFQANQAKMPTTTTTAPPQLNGCLAPPVPFPPPVSLKEDPTGKELADWMMKAGEVWLDLGQFDSATKCFKAVEQKSG
jgi:hypothetical protein